MQSTQFLSLLEATQNEKAILSELQPTMGTLPYAGGYDNSETEQGAAIQIKSTSVPDVWAKPPAASQFLKAFGSDDQGVQGVTLMRTEECPEHGPCGHKPQ